MSVCPCVRHKQKRAIRALNSESYSHLCYICGLFSASLCPPCNCPSVTKYKKQTDRLHLLILHQDLLPHPLLLLPPGNRRTYYTCPYYSKRFTTPPGNGRTDYTCPYYTKTFATSPVFCQAQVTIPIPKSWLSPTNSKRTGPP